MKNIQIFGINIAKTSKKELFKKIDSFLMDEKQHYLITLNPEILLHAGRDEEYFYILNQADLAIPDGVGLKFAAWACWQNLKIIPGADLVKDILNLASEKKWRVGIVNWSHGLSNEKIISRALKEKYSNLNFLVEDVSDKKAENFHLSKLLSFKPRILFITFGAPDQEKFIFHNLKKLPSVKLAMGVGASFDYISGQARRAPKIFRALGLEWLWRIFGFLSGQKKGRKKRIYNAVICFTLKFLKWRFVLPFFYRPNVCSLMYKKENDNYKFFIVKRSDRSDPHWQLPQGGVDKKEDIATAGARELREEAGTDKFKQMAIFKNLWHYKFDDVMGKYGVKHGYGWRGQKQSLFVAEFTGRDEDIKISFWDHDDWRWVDSEDLIRAVYPVRRSASEIYLSKFKELIKNKKYD